MLEEGDEKDEESDEYQDDVSGIKPTYNPHLFLYLPVSNCNFGLYTNWGLFID